MRAAALALCAALLFASVDVAGADQTGRPVVLLIHGGGFESGAAEDLGNAIRVAERLGFRADSLEYPLWDLPGAVRYVKHAARFYRQAGHPVYAYGESAGGALAGLLAVRGLVRSAALNSPVVNIATWYPEALPWIKATVEQARRFSPALHHSKKPILAVVPRHDVTVDSIVTYAWARRDPKVRAKTVPGPHLGGSFYGHDMRVALGYLARERQKDRGA